MATKKHSDNILVFAVEKIRKSESTISMLLGILVVVIVGVLLFRYFKSLPSKSKITIESEKSTELQESAAEKESTTSLPVKYKVQQGDSLWKISQKFYGNGFNWVDISRENKIVNPDLLEEGTELIIPDVPVKTPTTVDNQKSLQPISGSSYVVVKGDNLWEISVRAYQDGYKWQEIAKANNLANPSLIHPGNVLNIPR